MNRITRCIPLGRGLLLAGILAAGCGLLHAQNDAPPPPGPGGPMHRGGGGGPERQVEMLTKVLALTPDQQTQVKALLVEQHSKMEALRKATPAEATDAAPQGRPNRAQMEAIRTDTDSKISALLNDEQKTKFSALQAERAARMQHHGPADGPPPPPPGL